ncbi:MAG: alpha/beta hydrolase [Clostridia bacterium]|nr:alpha/beta hydrolase [Clostridia bacterium]
MFHGYRGTAERDLCGGVNRCFALERNVLIVDQRTAGKSEGRVITFGVKESRDCLSWIDFAIKTFGSDVKIILTGISMGAATVIMAAGTKLPENVIGVLADCGYTSAREMIKKTIKELNLPSNILYPFVKLGGLIFGGFNVDKATPIESIKKCSVPVLFVHGEADGFVPCEMSKQNFDNCPTRKLLHTVAGADHGLSFPVDPEGYLDKLYGFF